MRGFAFDAKKTLRSNFSPSKTAERDFYRQLKRVALVSGHIIDAHVSGVKISDVTKMQKELRDYSELIGPWAERQAVKLLEQVQKSNKRAYKAKSKAIGRILETGFVQSREGAVSMSLLNEQVGLIKSIPLEAGLRAQKIAFEAAVLGERAFADPRVISELEEQMGMTTQSAVSRALLISRTETAKANAAINQSRAQSAGSNQYRWHNSGDGAVRESHKYLKGKRLQGQIFSWDNPPTLDDGMRGHAGEFPNCRCFAEPVFND